MQFQVIRPDNSKHPFMRGMLAHKLMQRGLSFDQAYQISKDARSYFQQQSEVTTESLMHSVDELIVARYGHEVLRNLIQNFSLQENKSAFIEETQRLHFPKVY